MRNLLLQLAVVFILFSCANTPQKIKVFSECMNREIPVRVIVPKGYSKSTEYPVVYLLHGYGGNEESFLALKPNLQEDSNQYKMILVMPNGENSWYWDSPIDPNKQFATFITKELVNYIDSHYSTIDAPQGRAITGLSMGGQGALYHGIKSSDIFGACGSMSGGVDIRLFPNNWDIKDMLGSYSSDSLKWDRYAIQELVEDIDPRNANMLIDCGYDDFFMGVNDLLHNKLMQFNVPHDYIVRPGGHSASYWQNALDYQLLYFHKYFEMED